MRRGVLTADMTALSQQLNDLLRWHHNATQQVSPSIADHIVRFLRQQNDQAQVQVGQLCSSALVSFPHLSQVLALLQSCLQVLSSCTQALCRLCRCQRSPLLCGPHLPFQASQPAQS